MENYIFNTRRICPLCKKGQIVEKFSFAKENRGPTVQDQTILGQCIMRNPNKEDIRSHGHSCDNKEDCGVMYFELPTNLNNQNSDKILKALLCKKETLSEDKIVQMLFNETKTFKKGEEVYSYIWMTPGPRSSSIHDIKWSMDSYFISESFEGPFFPVQNKKDSLA